MLTEGEDFFEEDDSELLSLPVLEEISGTGSELILRGKIDRTTSEEVEIHC